MQKQGRTVAAQSSQQVSGKTYSVRAVLRALKGDHAVNAREVGAMAATAMGIELLLGEDVAAGLSRGRLSDHLLEETP